MLVPAYKELLLRSPYFQRMFSGSYAHSTGSPEGAEILPQMPVDILQVILHLFYGCGTACPIIQKLERLIKSPTLAVELLCWLDYFGGSGGPYHRRILELIANQPIDPGSYPLLLKTLSDTTFGRQWFRYLLWLPFGKTTKEPRMPMVEASLSNDSLADEMIEMWTGLFLYLLDPEGSVKEDQNRHNLALIALTQPLPIDSPPEYCDFPANNLI